MERNNPADVQNQPGIEFGIDMATDRLCLVSALERSMVLTSGLGTSIELVSRLEIADVLFSKLGRTISLVSRLHLEELER